MSTPTVEDQRERWSELLSFSPATDVITWADAIVDAPTDCTLVRPAEVGSIVVEVREPLAGERMQLCDLIVTSATVRLAGQLGWAMRQGDCPQAAVAQAICQAELERGGPAAPAMIERLEAHALREQNERTQEWEALTPTIVEFEEVL